ncbi:MAG: TetR/AcrR family transcriptional regulator [Spirochaetia bacterium]|nr:TetR/AcrR family transcriptional regulator [Spirochaetia bacterium]
MIRTRARNDEEKAEKAQLLTNAAAKLLKTKSYYELTTLDVTNEAGVSNGTLFVYFKTKEALFLHVLVQEHIKRQNDYYNMLKLIKITDFPMFKKVILTEMEDAFRTRPVLAKLDPLRTTVLEHNVDPQELITQRESVQTYVNRTAKAFTENFPLVTMDDMFGIFQAISALSIGFLTILEQPKSIAPQIDDHHLPFFKHNYIDQAVECMSIFLDGLKARKESEKSTAKS